MHLVSRSFPFFFFSCMSQKAQLPSLTGHRLKTRKRDEKKAYDPQGFRDAILEGLKAAGKILLQLLLTPMCPRLFLIFGNPEFILEFRLAKIR